MQQPGRLKKQAGREQYTPRFDAQIPVNFDVSINVTYLPKNARSTKPHFSPACSVCAEESDCRTAGPPDRYIHVYIVTKSGEKCELKKFEFVSQRIGTRIDYLKPELNRDLGFNYAAIALLKQILACREAPIGDQFALQVEKAD
jgi:hypothetical protein